MMLRKCVMMVAMLMACVSLWAVGVENNGMYRPHSDEKEPLPIDQNIRIVPPPTGGILRTSIKTDRDRYHVNDPVKISFGVNRDSYVYIFETDSRGQTRQMFPNYYDQNNFARAGKTYYIPDRGYDIEVLGPQGRCNLVIVAVMEDFPFLDDYKYYSMADPYPASREGATALVREIESFRREPSATTIQPIRPAIKENLWATGDSSFYVMDNQKAEPAVYKVARYGNLDVDTYPSNARIYVDSEYRGRSPQVIQRLDIGYHAVRLEKEGLIPYEVTVYIKGNETKQMDVFMNDTPLLPSQYPTDGQLRGGSINIFGWDARGGGAGVGAGAPACAPAAPVQAPPAQAPPPRPVYRDTIEK